MVNVTHRRVDGPSIVVGASGILAPLGAILKGRGVPGIGVSLSGGCRGDGWDRSVALDAKIPGQVEGLLSGLLGGPSSVVAYCEAMTARSWTVLASAAPVRVLVLTTGFADPSRPAAALEAWLEVGDVRVVQLGWSDQGRWHTPEQVSGAAAEALLAPGGNGLVLGRVRPWRDRPRLIREEDTHE